MDGITVKIDSDCMSDFELMAKREEPIEPTLELRDILYAIAQKMDCCEENTESVDIYFYPDPTQFDLDGFRVSFSLGEARVFLPVKVFSLVQYVSQPMLEAFMSDYEIKKNSAWMVLHNTICFFDPQWNSEKNCITCSVWWDQFGECLVKRLCGDANECKGNYHVICECSWQHVCSAHLQLINLPSKCQICCKTYSIEGPLLKKIKK